MASTNGEGAFIYTFLTGQPPFLGERQVSPSVPRILPLFVCLLALLMSGSKLAASGHSQHFLLIRETVICFFTTWLAAPCVRSGWPGPGMCARDARV